MRKRSAIAAVVACIVWCSSGSAADSGAVTSGGSFYVTWTSDPDPVPLNELFRIHFKVYRAGDRTALVPRAFVTASAWMPEHNHGTTLQPRVESHGDGTATGEGFLLHMRGRWELRVGVALDGQMERATFELVIDDNSFDERELRRILRLSPLGPPPPDPSNAHADDPRAARLGERLFFDRRLSADGAMSCATCHDPRRAWTNGERHTDTEERFPRNVPSVRNSSHNRWYYWDGRADSAWSQALGPMENDRELASNRLALLHLIAGDPALRKSYQEIFGSLPDGVQDPRRFPPAARPVPDQPEHPLQRAWAAMAAEDREAANAVFANIGKAIAAFERGIEVGESPFDRMVAALRRGDAAATSELSPAAIRGLKLFVGRGECTLCHSGPNLSDGEFHDVGIALGKGQRIDPGRHRGVITLLRSPFTRTGNYADTSAPDAPIQFLDAQTDQLGSFKTPTLRGVAETAPYMHDGRFDTLEQVVRFYSTREGASPLGHPTTLLKPLKLSERETADLVAFLESLSGTK